MTKKERKKAIRVLTEHIEGLHKKLTQLYEMKSDAEAKEGLYLPLIFLPYIDIFKIEKDCLKLEMVIADLRNMRQSLRERKGTTIVKCVDQAGMTPIEFNNAIEAALNPVLYENDGFSNVFYLY